MRTLRDRLENGTVVGSFVFSVDPAISEIYAEAGFDFVVVDLEHAMNDIRTALAHVRASEARGIPAIIRVGKSTEGDVPRLLDAGAAGIMFPHFGLPSATGPSATRYPPQGVRPTCTGIRAAAYGLVSFAQYAERSNRDVYTIGLVEDAQALEVMDGLLEEGAVDCVMPGPADLASSFGAHGNFQHPRVVEAVNAVIDGAGRHRRTAGMYVSTPQEISRWHAAGTRLFVLSIDYKLFGSGLERVRRESRDILAKLDAGEELQD